jgi:hypothetical protein
MRAGTVSPGVALAALLALVPAAGAQSLADRVSAAPEGTVRVAFASKPDLCGDGVSYISRRDGWRRSWGREPGADCPCEFGPARLTLRVSGGRVVDLAAGVGGSWKPVTGPVTDLGTVPVAEAGRYLLALARASRSGDVGEDAVFAATLADSITVWPGLLEIAREDGLPRDTRKSATFWLGRIAGDAVAARLGELVEDEGVDVEIREHAIFALSQRPADEGVPALIEVVRTNRNPRLVKKALFWLGDTGDPRALALFEEILTRR